MTAALVFPSEEALRVAITSELVPASVVAGAAQGWRTHEGAVIVKPVKALSATVLRNLSAAGARTSEQAPPDTAAVASCWAELIPLRREASTVDQGEGEVLFLLADADAMLETAGELLRLGCDRQDLRAVQGTFVLRVASPPYYTLARAIDRIGGIRAFAPTPKGQDRVYVETGYTHPLAGSLRPAAGRVLFLAHGEPWRSLPEGSWTDIYSAVDLVVPEKRHELTPPSVLPRLSVKMRLARGGHRDPPTLWVVRNDAVLTIERLLGSVPDDITAGLLFAVSDEDPPQVILRARPGARKAITLEIEADELRPHLQITNLFMPCYAILEPPLRRDKVRDLIAPDPNFVTWLVANGPGDDDFQVRRIREAAFRPLTEWVEYVVDTSAPLLAEWVRSARFDFARFEVFEPAPQATRHAHEREDEREPEPKEASKIERAPRAAPLKVVKKTATEAVRVRIVTEPAEQNPLLDALAECEKTFRELDVAADDPRRSALWRTMADLNHRLGRGRDAALCWTRAMWDLPADEARGVAAEWTSAEAADRTLEALLSLETPTKDDVRAVASAVVMASLTPSTELDAHRAALWLDRHDDTLDLRSLWLARVSLSRLVGHDALALARARDRLLVKLHRGVSVERDVPTFLRFAYGGRDAGQVDLLVTHLSTFLASCERGKRVRSAVEADPKLTLAYVHLVFAYGMARLGKGDDARALLARATGTLDLNEPIHGFLARAFAARISQALEGLSPETPLPADVAARLNELDKISRYKVDRVRQISKVLEPHERLDPVVAFQRGGEDPRGPEFALLRAMDDSAAIEREVDTIFKQAKNSPPDDRARLFDGVMDFFPMLGIERATGYLEDLTASLGGIAPARQAQLLEEALMLAGHVGNQDLGRRIFKTLDPLIASLGAESAAEIAPVMGGMLRTLRRVGLREEASQLLETMQRAAVGKGTPAMVARLHTAAGLAYLGHFDRARTVFEETLGTLSGDLLVPARIELTRALCRAVSNAPLDYAVAALAKLSERLSVVTDSFNTNSHVCLSVIGFVEAIVLGYASEDLTIGELGRHWLDDDEFLIRRRIHRDTGPSR